MNDKLVHHPKHYQHFGLETIEIIEMILNQNPTLSPFQAYCMGNELKYRLRAGLKDGNTYQRDIEKALKYRDFRLGTKPEATTCDLKNDKWDLN